MKTADCQRLGFKAAIYPCTGFVPAMLAMQKSYSALKRDGTDLGHCEGNRIQDFFKQLGLAAEHDFSDKIEEWIKERKIGN